jgi:hypothetical protein
MPLSFQRRLGNPLLGRHRPGSSPEAPRRGSHVGRVTLWDRAICEDVIVFLALVAGLAHSPQCDGTRAAKGRRIPGVNWVTGWDCWSCGVNSRIQHFAFPSTRLRQRAWAKLVLGAIAADEILSAGQRTRLAKTDTALDLRCLCVPSVPVFFRQRLALAPGLGDSGERLP